MLGTTISESDKLFINNADLEYTPIMAKPYFQHHYSSYQCHMTLKKSF